LLRVYFDPSFLKHNPGGWHPESSARLETIIRICGSFPGIEITGSCPKADPTDIELIHTAKYFDYVMSFEGQQAMLDPDTGLSPDSIEAALKAVGAGVEAVKFVVRGSNRRAFCAVRPPGHHAEKDRARGFCIFNNIAIAAAYALKNKLASKIAIVDFDVHHGNGTQQAFYNTPDVLYISSHQYPYFPGSGAADEIGDGDGEGYTINIPMRYGSVDEEYRRVFNDIVVPVVDKYRPDLILNSAGFDAHQDDPLAGMKLSSEIYGEITKMIVDLAIKHCYGRVVSFLEGGYNLPALEESVRFHLKELLNG
jgi:acetoin utilization deacetylase AcuC-like enzyme